LSVLKRKRTIAGSKKEAFLTHRPSWLEREQKSLNETLSYLGRDNPSFNLRTLTVVLIVISSLAFLAGLTMNNILLACILAFGAVWVPYEYLKFKSFQLRRDIDDDIGLFISWLSNSIESERTVQKAIDKVKDTAPLRLRPALNMFLRDVRDLNYGVSDAIEQMSIRIESSYWTELCESLKQINDDSDMLSLLPALAGRLSDERSLEREWDLILNDNLREFMTNIILCIGLVLILRFGMNDVFVYLAETPLGKTLVSAVAIILILCTTIVLRTLKPLHLMNSRK